MSLLRDELLSGPLSEELAELVEQNEHGLILAAFERADIPAKKALETAEIKRYLLLHNLYLPILDATNDTCRVAIAALEEFEYFHLNETDVLSMFTNILNALITDGKITQTDKDNLLAMGDTYISRADELDFPISIPLIAEALAEV